MPPLRFVHYLSEHHEDAARQMASLLGDRLGIGVDFEAAPLPTRRRLIEGGEADLLWMCGFLTRKLIDQGRLETDIAAAPLFQGEAGAVYRTLVVVPARSGPRRLADVQGSRLIINEAESWSGHHALAVHLMEAGIPLPFFAEVSESGSHAASLRAVLADEADCAALDSSIWAVLPTDVKDRLRIVDRTRDWPAPPLSISHRIDAHVRRELIAALTTAQPHPAVEGFVAISQGAYDEMAEHRPMEI